MKRWFYSKPSWLCIFLIVFFLYKSCTGSGFTPKLVSFGFLVQKNVLRFMILNSFLIHFLLIRFFFLLKKVWIWAFSFGWPFGKCSCRKLIWASKSLTSILGSQKIKIKIWIWMDLYESPKSTWKGESKSKKHGKERSLFFNFRFWHGSQLFP